MNDQPQCEPGDLRASAVLVVSTNSEGYPVFQEVCSGAEEAEFYWCATCAEEFSVFEDAKNHLKVREVA